MKNLIIVFFCLLSTSAFSQQMSYAEWQEKAKTEIRMLPEYGNVPKSAGQIEADEKFIAEELKENGTRRNASEKIVKIGFNYLYKGDLKIAMYRFNQAWLLDPKNENAYWGFGVVYFNFNDFGEALKQFEKGLQLNPQSSNILTDKATIYMQFYGDKQDNTWLQKAIKLFNQSYKIDPSNQNTSFKLSAAYYYQGDCKNAWKFYDECMKLGGQQISPGYLEALKKQCNR